MGIRASPSGRSLSRYVTTISQLYTQRGKMSENGSPSSSFVSFPDHRGVYQGTYQYLASHASQAQGDRERIGSSPASDMASPAKSYDSYSPANSFVSPPPSQTAASPLLPPTSRVFHFENDLSHDVRGFSNYSAGNCYHGFGREDRVSYPPHSIMPPPHACGRNAPMSSFRDFHARPPQHPLSSKTHITQPTADSTQYYHYDPDHVPSVTTNGCYDYHYVNSNHPHHDWRMGPRLSSSAYPGSSSLAPTPTNHWPLHSTASPLIRRRRYDPSYRFAGADQRNPSLSHISAPHQMRFHCPSPQYSSSWNQLPSSRLTRNQRNDFRYEVFLRKSLILLSVFICGLSFKSRKCNLDQIRFSSNMYGRASV